jgi:hypothetical protein
MTRRDALLGIALTCLVQASASNAITALSAPFANVHACIPYTDGGLNVSAEGQKIARNFTALVVDHLRDGNPNALSLTIFRGPSDAPNSDQLLSVRNLTQSDRDYIEQIFGYELARLATGGANLVYHWSQEPQQCGIEARAILDMSLSRALCGAGLTNCLVECTVTECKSTSQ